MLTPQEITEKVFVKAVFGGYDMTGVDDFLEELSADYAALYKENAILKSKLKVLVEKVEEYRSTEDAMRMALLTAQRMGEEITSEANKKKDETIRGAEMEARARLAETARQIADEELRLSVAAKETAKFIELSQAIMRKHSDFLTKLESARRTVRPEPEPPPPQRPTYEQQVAEAAEQIGNAVDRLTDSGMYAPDDEYVPEYDEGYDAEPVPLYDDEGEPTRQYSVRGGDESVTPRPKFDFDDLKFGSNFDGK
jgi:cell division initiation protein